MHVLLMARAERSEGMKNSEFTLNRTNVLEGRYS